jgi:hypothetical protein
MAVACSCDEQLDGLAWATGWIAEFTIDGVLIWLSWAKPNGYIERLAGPWAWIG